MLITRPFDLSSTILKCSKNNSSERKAESGESIRRHLQTMSEIDRQRQRQTKTEVDGERQRWSKTQTGIDRGLFQPNLQPFLQCLVFDNLIFSPQRSQHWDIALIRCYSTFRKCASSFQRRAFLDSVAPSADWLLQSERTSLSYQVNFFLVFRLISQLNFHPKTLSD